MGFLWAVLVDLPSGNYGDIQCFIVLNNFYTLGDDWCVTTKTVISPGTCHLNRMELKLQSEGS